MKIEDNEQLAEFIADHLPISSEDAWHFVDGVLKGCMFNDKINFTIALSVRDKRIEDLQDENQELRRKIMNLQLVPTKENNMYEVGDRVKILDAMARDWIGKEAEITKVITVGILCYELNIGGGHWTHSMLEKM